MLQADACLVKPLHCRLHRQVSPELLLDRWPVLEEVRFLRQRRGHLLGDELEEEFHGVMQVQDRFRAKGFWKARMVQCCTQNVLDEPEAVGVVRERGHRGQRIRDTPLSTSSNMGRYGRVS